jgi:hypothetical protein
MKATLLSALSLAFCVSAVHSQGAPNEKCTSFIADGAVGNALRSKDEPRPATGSLGLRHHASHEEFGVLIAVASTVDTIKGVDGSRAAFAKALLTPGAVGRGNGASGALDYKALTTPNSNDQRVGVHALASFSNATWRVEGGGTTAESDLTVLAGSVRAHWIPINRPPKGCEPANTFSFEVEAGWTIRSIAGDAADDKEFKARALGDTRGIYHGPELAFAIKLRQVTASAVLPLLGALGGPKLKGLTGLQPVVSFSLDAPLFTF